MPSQGIATARTRLLSDSLERPYPVLTHRTTLVVLACLLLGLSSVPGATINYQGAELSVGDGVRTTTVEKSLDVNGDNVLGTDGYYYWNPDDQLGNQGGDSGADFSANAIVNLPSYVDAIQPATDAASAADFDYHALDDPTEVADASVPDLEAGQATVQNWTPLADDNTFVAEEKEAFDIVLGATVPAGGFRMAFVQDTYLNGGKPGKNMPASFRVSGAGGDTGQISLHRTSRRDVDIYYVDVTAPSPGDRLTVFLTTHEDSIQPDGTSIANQIATSTLAFDTPEPTMAVLALGTLLLWLGIGHRS